MTTEELQEILTKVWMRDYSADDGHDEILGEPFEGYTQKISDSKTVCPSPGGLAASTWLSELEAALMHAKKAHKAIPNPLVGAKHYTDVAVKALVDALESNRSHSDNNGVQGCREEKL